MELGIERRAGLLKVRKDPHDWPYGKDSPPARGDLIFVFVEKKRELASVRFWNRFAIWLRARTDGRLLWLTLREIEFNYARKWK